MKTLYIRPVAKEISFQLKATVLAGSIDGFKSSGSNLGTPDNHSGESFDDYFGE